VAVDARGTRARPGGNGVLPGIGAGLPPADCHPVSSDWRSPHEARSLPDGSSHAYGLHGKSFIPMLSGYACAVPGIMATRTIEDPKDRLATIMVVPLMSCSARLPVYTLLIGSFVPPVVYFAGVGLQGLTMLGMYLLGTLAALGAAAIFKRTLLKGPVRPMILELPGYRWPSLHSLAVSVAQRCRLFLRRAGTVILSLSIVLWAMATYPRTAVDATLPEEAPGVRRPKIGVSIVASLRRGSLCVDDNTGVTVVTAVALGGLRAERNPTGAPTHLVAVNYGLRRLRPHVHQHRGRDRA
jgi:Fe2+ transport system protein B